MTDEVNWEHKGGMWIIYQQVYWRPGGGGGGGGFYEESLTYPWFFLLGQMTAIRLNRYYGGGYQLAK